MAAPAEAATSAATDGATVVHRTSVVINGHLDPGTSAEVVDCRFEWGPTDSYGSFEACAEGMSFSEPEDVSASIGNLIPGETYHYRLLVETNSGESRQGRDRTVTLAEFPVGRAPLRIFGPDGSASSTFTALSQLAIDDSGSRLYAFSSKSPTGIYGFDISSEAVATPLPGFEPLPTAAGGLRAQIAVDGTDQPSAGNVYLASDPSGSQGVPAGTDMVYGFASDGNPLGGNFPLQPSSDPGGLPSDAHVCGVDVDSDGNVWVGMGNSELVLEYTAKGEFVRSLNTHYFKDGFSGARPICRLAFDSSDNLYFAYPNGRVWRYPAPDYEAIDDRAIAIGGDVATGQIGGSIALNPSTDNFFGIDFGSSRILREFDPDGQVVREIGSEIRDAVYAGVAADSVDNEVYVSDRNQIRVFGPPGPQLFPTVTTRRAGSITDDTARLRGFVDPEGQGAITDCAFEWGVTLDYSSSEPCDFLPGPASGDQAVGADLDGLMPGVTYHFRLRAGNAAGSVEGEDQTFTAAVSEPPIKALETLEATSRTNTSATLRGTLNPDGLVIDDCHFEYVAEAQYLRAKTDESQLLSVSATSGNFTLEFEGESTAALPSNATSNEIEQALNALGAIGGSPSGASVGVVETRPGLFTLQFRGALGSSDLPTVIAHGGDLIPAGSIDIETTIEGGDGFGPASDIAECSPPPGSATDQMPVRATLDGLEPNTAYRFRLSATNANGTGVGDTLRFVTRGPATAETVGAPNRTAASIELGGRLIANGAPTTYHFEYGIEPCDASQCVTTADREIEPEDESVLVSETINGLEPDTTYYYRLVADNGNHAGPTLGGVLSSTTRATEEPLEHGNFPGPTGSDRAWEQVNAPNTGGNPVLAAQGVSTDGNRAVYQVAGGSPDSKTGTTYSQFLGERSDSGWQLRQFQPPRNAFDSTYWAPPTGTAQLDVLFGVNGTWTSSTQSIWRLSPDSANTKLIGDVGLATLFVSADGSAIAANIFDASLDSDHVFEGLPHTPYLYDLSSGSPELESILPDGTIASCGSNNDFTFGLGTGSEVLMHRTTRWISDDGDGVVFPSQGNDCTGGEGSSRLYWRDLGADTTRLVTPRPLSGRDCSSAFINATEEYVYFWTQSRLTDDDAEIPGPCAGTQQVGEAKGGDIYRYSILADDVSCVTCDLAAVAADVRLRGGRPGDVSIAVADDDSRLYFQSLARLDPAAPPPGKLAAYRLDLRSGDLAVVAPLNDGDLVGNSPGYNGSAINGDGSALMFRSANPNLNATGGRQNGGTAQYYRYDDDDRSLVCVSCPALGVPRGGVAIQLLASAGVVAPEVSPNMSPMDADGNSIFATPTGLVDADRNTAEGQEVVAAGIDVYEWRDGRQLLISDGRTSWPGEAAAPKPATITASGRDAFFLAAAKLTPDAPDGVQRLYDARIGGGIVFEDDSHEDCIGDSCQGSSGVEPPGTDPGSTVPGSGNPSTEPPPAASCERLEARSERLKSRQRHLTRRLDKIARRLRIARRHGYKPRVRSLKRHKVKIGVRKTNTRKRIRMVRARLHRCERRVQS